MSQEVFEELNAFLKQIGCYVDDDGKKAIRYGSKKPVFIVRRPSGAFMLFSTEKQIARWVNREIKRWIDEGRDLIEA